MSYPPLPSAPPPGSAEPDPGSIPLRPLRAVDVLGQGLRVVLRHLRLLGPIAIVLAAISSAADLLILHGTGVLDSFASGAWLSDWSDALNTGHATALPTGIYATVTASSAITTIGALILAGVAAACVSVDAIDRQPNRQALRTRLAGRAWPLIVTALIVGVATIIGLFAFVIPGILIFATWALAVPIAVVERAGVGTALARAAHLARGHRWRIFGVTLLIVVIVGAIESFVSSIAGAVVPSLSPVTSLIVGDAVTTVVSAVTLSWVGAVVALLYTDVRFRKENLAHTLRTYARGQRPFPSTS